MSSSDYNSRQVLIFRFLEEKVITRFCDEKKREKSGLHDYLKIYDLQF